MSELEKAEFDRGVKDCQNNLLPREYGAMYMNGYGSEYAKEQQQSQGKFN